MLKTFRSLLLITALLLTSAAYADRIELACCDDDTNPTTLIYPGSEDTQYNVNFVGLKVKGYEDDIVTKLSSEGRDYLVWARSIVIKYGKTQKTLNIINSGKKFTHVAATCSSGSSTRLMGTNRTVDCPTGDSLTIKFYSPVCGKLNSNAILEVTKTIEQTKSKTSLTVDSDLMIPDQLGEIDLLQQKAGLLSGLAGASGTKQIGEM